jgi:quercetin dioxygenase-like cupin family protein
MTDRVVVDPTLGHKLAFRSEPDEDGIEVSRIEMWVEPGGGVPPHVHPSIEESFTVLDGVAELLSGRSWRPAGPGETVVVAPGTRHAYRNRGEEIAHVVCIAKPASASLEEFLTEAAELNRRGLLSKAGLPKRPAAILPAVALAHRHREMVTLGFPLPPAPVQRLLFPPLARLAERRGVAHLTN